jgi:protein-S-isoprenylcysteine O-methyltransferase Ste14
MKQAIIAVLWIGWVVYWLAVASPGKAVARHESAASRYSYVIPMVIGGLLIAHHGDPSTWIGSHFLPPAARPAGYWLGVVLMAAGLGFTVWARNHLAGNWSATVTIKEGHELVRTGPYAWVRHPIYTGILVAFVGTALAGARWTSVFGLVFVTGALIRKLTLEERWMAEMFPEYAAYRAQVAALIPFIY